MNAQPALVFSPFAGIWPHAFPEALVAAELGKEVPIVYASCDGLLDDGCTTMDAHGLRSDATVAQRRRVCIKCRSNRRMLHASLGATGIFLEKYLTPDDMAQVDGFVQSVEHGKVLDLVFDGHPVGRYAIHEPAIHYKITSEEELTGRAFADFTAKLRHILLILVAGRKLLVEIRPRVVIMYNTHLSTNYAFTRMSERLGIPVYGFHSGMNMSERLATLYVFRSDMVVLYKDWIARFDAKWCTQPVDRDSLRRVGNHFVALTQGRVAWVYSSPKKKTSVDVRQLFGIRPSQKILLATLSSYDELYSSQVMGVMPEYPLLFNSQAEWIQTVIDHLRDRKDLFLIIRVHPREFPNHRDSVMSAHAQRLATVLSSLPDNVAVNWPTQNLSLYDLAIHADVGLNGWSSAGKELALLGIPVVLYTRDLIYYPASINHIGETRDTYFTALDIALRQGWSAETIRRTFRWLSYEYTLGTLDVRDAFKYAEGDRRRSLVWRILNRAARYLHVAAAPRYLKKPRLARGAEFRQALLHGKDVIELNQALRNTLTEEQEWSAIREEVGRILATVYSAEGDGRSVVVDKLRAFVRGASADASRSRH